MAKRIRDNALTSDEKRLLKTLPRPPQHISFSSTNVWIVEWLSDSETRTGLQLHDWMGTTARRPGWSRYIRCDRKQAVFQAIAAATREVRKSKIIPILHIEAHGGPQGLSGPDEKGRPSWIGWTELTSVLQPLNEALNCNLFVFFAACEGCRGVMACTRGPTAPLLAIVGPTTEISYHALREASKEFYRGIIAGRSIDDIVANMANEAGTAPIGYIPFTGLAYDAIIPRFIASLRPKNFRSLQQHYSDRLRRELGSSEFEVMLRMSQFGAIQIHSQQMVWNQMFFIDKHPENAERFGLDFADIARRIVDAGLHLTG